MKRVTVAILSLLVMAGLMVVLQAPIAAATYCINSVGGSATHSTRITCSNQAPYWLTTQKLLVRRHIRRNGYISCSYVAGTIDGSFTKISNTSTAGGNLLKA